MTAIRLTGIRACMFDAYGTLFEATGSFRALLTFFRRFLQFSI